ncbi:response regulator [Noviherbaspirillum suwonense]|jgi:CheY-like chemotaxis protein|uniref:histidine kinase n=1 Tax=Noviherbaspirillum suwonense TaxID=1224511 RepID=A0ABY1QF71_9BURK|nr:response regulator [Noviherbaspirillum suwonense]SMP66043.1 Response regulator receiver domain-containing protein [Noviherbaspirillum suwonense]
MESDKNHLLRVLVVDDQEIAASLACDMLTAESDIDVSCLYDARMTVQKALGYRPSVILIDLCMPTMDGFSVIRALRALPETVNIPIILVSSQDAPEQKVRGFTAGANDYLVKWPARAELVARVRYHAQAYRARAERDEAYASLQTSQEQLLQRTRELELSQAALHQAQKLEAIGQLTGGVAHDFNNVLQIIGGNLQLLGQNLAITQADRGRVDVAMAAVERGANLATQLLAFARQQPLEPVVVPLDGILHNMHQMVRHTLGEGIEVHTGFADGLWNSLIDTSQFENVILNLALNARDAMGGRGQLTLVAENVELDQRYASAHPEVRPGQYIRVAVSDTGCGIPPELIERVFEPFFTTKLPGEGTGLGLSMAYGFVQQSGGHIALESTLGTGTTVSVYLPRSMEPVESQRAHQSANAAGGSERILAVEDDPALRATVVQMLEGLGYQVVEAGDAASALAIIENGESFDLLFTDVVMPGPLRSTELVDRARALLPGMGVLYTSGYAENAIVHGGRLDPGVTLLSKPYRREQLATKVRQILDRRPAAAAAASAPAAAREPAPQRLLLVEDNADLLDLTLMMLEELGHEATGVPTAEEALALLEKEAYAMLLTDITLPKMSGIELVALVRSRYPQMPVAIASGYGRSPELDGQDVSYLKKPYQLSDLQQIIRQGLRQTAPA